jgi:hypothetical protein
MYGLKLVPSKLIRCAIEIEMEGASDMCIEYVSPICPMLEST